MENLDLSDLITNLEHSLYCRDLQFSNRNQLLYEYGLDASNPPRSLSTHVRPELQEIELFSGFVAPPINTT